jgi:hypothetical protein
MSTIFSDYYESVGLQRRQLLPLIYAKLSAILMATLMYSLLLCAERGDCRLLDKYRGFDIFSMKQTGVGKKLSVTRANAASRNSSCLAKHLLQPLFKSKMVYNYGLCI